MASLLRDIAEFREELRSVASSDDEKPLWKPYPDSPQERTLLSEADEIFLGGSAGGGKTDCILGIALTMHLRSIIFRREYPQLRSVIERAQEIVGARGRINANAGTLRMDGRLLEFGSAPNEKDVQRYQGRPHDFIGIDEAPQFSESQIRFLMGWNRSAVEGQRCRVILCGNPPTRPEGRWVVKAYEPWLDSAYHDPAEPGELRWYAMLNGELTWLKPDCPVVVKVGDKEQELVLRLDDKGKPLPIVFEAREGKTETIKPRSRTFIPARLDDNPALRDSGYRSVLQGMPEPLRSQMLYGDFTAGTQDDAWQVIPTEWVRAAQARWRADDPRATRPLDAIGVDVARGGSAKTVLSPRHGIWFAPLIKQPGTATPDGGRVLQLILLALNGRKGVQVNLDIGGIGTATYDSAKMAGVESLLTPVNFGSGVNATNRSNTLSFVNMRAYMYWSLREALDPQTGDGLILPPDPELLADLTSPRWEMRAGGVLVEKKEDIEARIGRSPDAGDSVVLSHLQLPRSQAGITAMVGRR